MKLLILAAGYATRLYPLTLNKAKPLLDVAGKPMIEHVLATALSLKQIDHIYVVTNNKFAASFESWALNYQLKIGGPTVTVVNDRSTCEDDRLGAIGDMQFVISDHRTQDDLLVIGGDNLFDEKIDGFMSFAQSHGPTVGVYDVGSLELAKKYGIVAVDDASRLTYFEEKPAQPRSTLAAICLYFYPHAVLPQIGRYLLDGNNPDQPGRLVQWLYTRIPFFAREIKGRWLDIGGHESYELANREFAATKPAPR
jgi:glucose-1-phosphate thymidylyltransferase